MTDLFRFSGYAVIVFIIAGFFSALRAEEVSQVKPDTITLIANGTSGYTIVIPDKDERNRVAKAATLLQELLEKSTGIKLPVEKESHASAKKPHIYLGKTRAALKAGIPFEKLKEWTFCKRVVEGNLFLSGYDASANINGPLEFHDREYLLMDMGMNSDVKDRSYKEYLGTYKAVTSFLEDEIGVRFLLPGPNGLYVPKQDTVAVPADLNILTSARFPYCYGRSYGSLTIAHNHNEIPYYKNYGGHSFPVAVSKKLYEKTHPEYFVLVDGKRQPEFGRGGAGHLCISNPEVQELMLKELERQYAFGFDWVQVGHTDGYTACQCEKCRALAGDDKGEALWIVYRKLAEEMKRRQPDKKIVLLAYAETKFPPKTFDSFPDNVIVELCTFAPETQERMFLEWKKFTTPKLLYVYLWGNYHTSIFCPKRSPAFLAKQLRRYAQANVQGIFKCGFGDSIGLEGPAYYVFGKLLFDPYADPEKIADDFYRAAYGKSYDLMKRFFDIVHSALDFRDGRAVIDVLYKQPRCPDYEIPFIFQAYPMRSMRRLLNGAIARDKAPQVQARLKLVEREFSYVEALRRIYADNDAYFMSNSEEVLTMLKKDVQRFDRMVDAWYDKKGNIRTAQGFDWPFFDNLPAKIIKNGGGQICAPFAGVRKLLNDLRKN